MRGWATGLLVAIVAGCASAPQDDGLLASTPLFHSMEREEGDVVAVGRFSRLKAGETAPGWEPYTVQAGNPLTRYEAREVDGVVCICADAKDGQSALQRLIRIDPREHPVLEWSWRVPRMPDGPPSKVSPRARLMLAFHGDAAKLDIDQRIHLRLAKAMTGRGLPYASLVYVWEDGREAESVFRSPYSERVRHISLGAGEDRLDRWLAFRRNVREDFRRAFGEEPGEIVGVAIYTDVLHDGKPGLAYYGDITFRREPPTTAR